MLILVAAVLAIAAVPVAGGRLGALGELRLVGVRLLMLALVLQVLVISVVPGWPRPLLEAVHVGTYLLAGIFAWRNRRVPGIAIVALGGALNGITIVLNGGVLPASPAALRRAGIAHSPDEFINAGVLPNPRLPWLGDVFAGPGVLAAGQRLQHRRRADPGRRRLGRAPHLRVRAGPLATPVRRLRHAQPPGP